MTVTTDRRPLPILINKLDDVHRLVERVYESGTKYTYDFETIGMQVAKLKVAGLGVAWGSEEGQGAYILTEHLEYPSLNWEQVLPILKPLFEDPSMRMIAHNQLYDATILDYYGVNLHTNTFDTMLASWLLNTSTPNGLKGLIERIYGHKMTELKEFCIEERVNWHPEKVLRLDKADIDKMRDYGVEDVLWTYRLYEDALLSIEKDPFLNKVYMELYQEVMDVLTAMQSDGIALDLGHLAKLKFEYGKRMDELFWNMQALRPGQDFDPLPVVDMENEEARMALINQRRKHIPELQTKWGKSSGLRDHLYARPDLAHKIFNPDSGPQLAKVLFDEIGLEPIGKKLPSGVYSTSKEAMSKLVNRDESGFVSAYQEYNTLGSLYSNFIITLPERADADDRVRTNFRPTLATGRLASNKPNLMNIPARTPEGAELRKAFVARPGHALVVADYSQMEMRIVAHFSGDRALTEGFHKGADPHSATAHVAFNLECDVLEVKEKFPDERAIAKTINFALLYGAGAEKLASQITEATKGRRSPSVEEAQNLKTHLLAQMPDVKFFIRRTEAFAREHGLVRTITNRPRHISDAKLPQSDGRYHAAMRQAVNTIIQGSAADIILIAMRNIRRTLLERNWWRTEAHLLLQVHDELVFEVREEHAEELAQLVKHDMENAIKLSVPIEAEPGVGGSWYSAK